MAFSKCLECWTRGKRALFDEKATNKKRYIIKIRHKIFLSFKRLQKQNRTRPCYLLYFCISASRGQLQGAVLYHGGANWRTMEKSTKLIQTNIQQQEFEKSKCWDRFLKSWTPHWIPFFLSWMFSSAVVSHCATKHRQADVEIQRESWSRKVFQYHRVSDMPPITGNLLRSCLPRTQFMNLEVLLCCLRFWTKTCSFQRHKPSGPGCHCFYSLQLWCRCVQPTRQCLPQKTSRFHRHVWSQSRNNFPSAKNCLLKWGKDVFFPWFCNLFGNWSLQFLQKMYRFGQSTKSDRGCFLPVLFPGGVRCLRFFVPGAFSIFDQWLIDLAKKMIEDRLNSQVRSVLCAVDCNNFFFFFTISFVTTYFLSRRYGMTIFRPSWFMETNFQKLHVKRALSPVPVTSVTQRQKTKKQAAKQLTMEVTRTIAAWASFQIQKQKWQTVILHAFLICCHCCDFRKCRPRFLRFLWQDTIQQPRL